MAQFLWIAILWIGFSTGGKCNKTKKNGGGFNVWGKCKGEFPDTSETWLKPRLVMSASEGSVSAQLSNKVNQDQQLLRSKRGFLQGPNSPTCYACYMVFNYTSNYLNTQPYEKKFIKMVTKWCKENAPIGMSIGCKLLKSKAETKLREFMHNLVTPDVACPKMPFCQQPKTRGMAFDIAKGAAGMAFSAAGFSGGMAYAAAWATGSWLAGKSSEAMCAQCKSYVNTVYDNVTHAFLSILFDFLKFCDVLQMDFAINMCNKKRLKDKLIYPNIIELFVRQPDRAKGDSDV